MRVAETANAIALQHVAAASQKSEIRCTEPLLKRKRTEVPLERMKFSPLSKLSVETAEFQDIEFLAQKISEYLKNRRLTIEEKKELVVLIVSEKDLSMRDQTILKSRIQFLLRNSFLQQRRSLIEELFRDIRARSNYSGIDFSVQQRRMERINELLCKILK